jgi:hypothetical protein
MPHATQLGSVLIWLRSITQHGATQKPLFVQIGLIVLLQLGDQKHLWKGNRGARSVHKSKGVLARNTNFCVVSPILCCTTKIEPFPFVSCDQILCRTTQNSWLVSTDLNGCQADQHLLVSKLEGFFMTYFLDQKQPSTLLKWISYSLLCTKTCPKNYMLNIT